MKALTSLLLLCCLWVTSSVHAEGEEGQDDLLQYIEMKPSFVLNFGDLNPKLRYLKAEISLRVDKRSAAAAVERHMPALRNEVVLLLSRQTDEVMMDTIQREALRMEILKAVQTRMEAEEGTPMIVDLLFTDFIVQR